MQSAILRVRGAALLGCFLILPGSFLRGEEKLLKEYIYLNGRLLAVEHQVVNISEQKPAGTENQRLKIEYAAVRQSLSPAVSETRLSSPLGSPADEHAANIGKSSKQAEAGGTQHAGGPVHE
jgi:hypothetical protein